LLYITFIGLGNNIFQYIPQKIILNNLKFKKVSAGFRHSLIISQNDEVYSFGYAFHGRITHGSDQNVPKLIFFEEKILDISAGASHSIVLTKNKKIYTFGDNGNGQLGIYQNLEYTHSPVLVESPEFENEEIYITGGVTTIIYSNKRAYIAGNNFLININ
jgi:alpha-tubulin suppressor-like RCC1 family protein